MSILCIYIYVCVCVCSMCMCKLCIQYNIPPPGEVGGCGGNPPYNTRQGTCIYKHPAGPETVPIKRTFFQKIVILPQCRADLMIGNPGKTWGAFFGSSASSLQRMRRYQLAVSILVNASPLPSSSIHHQEVTFGTQVARN